MKAVAKKVSVLGTDYTIRFVEQGQDKYMDDNNLAGYCDAHSHDVVVLILKSTKERAGEPEESLERQQDCTIRHELTHAFLNESGLRWDSYTSKEPWAVNEEMVDWIAIQSPKIFKLFSELGVL